MKACANELSGDFAKLVLSSTSLTDELRDKTTVKVVGKLEVLNMSAEELEEIIESGNCTFNLDKVELRVDDKMREAVLRALNLHPAGESPILISMKGRAYPSLSCSHNSVKHDFQRKGTQNMRFEYMRQMSLEKRRSLVSSFEKKLLKPSDRTESGKQRTEDPKIVIVEEATKSADSLCAIKQKDQANVHAGGKEALKAGSALEEMITYRSDLASTRSALTARNTDELMTN